jgi:hypothetical protein
LHRYTVTEGGMIHCSCGGKYHPRQLLRFMHFDPYNAKGSRSKSRPGLGVIGTSTDKHVFLLDYSVERHTQEQLFEKVFSFNDQWKPCLFTYEDVGNQAMAEVYIRQAQNSSDFKHRRMPYIKPCTTGNRAKEIRIRDHLLPALTRYKFAVRSTQLHFLESLATFPHPVPDHDYDLMDALAQGAPHWRFPESEDRAKEQQINEEEFLAHLGKPFSHFNIGVM